MEEKRKITVEKGIYDKLEKLAEKLNIDVSELADVAFKELFNQIKDEPEIFLENIGLIDKLKEITKNKKS